MWRLVAAACLLVVIVDGAQRSLPSGELRDFGSFVASAKAGAEGQNPYGIHPLTFHVVLPGFDVWNPNLNPPVSVLLFRSFDQAAPRDAFRWWWGISFVCYLFAVALVAQRYGGDERPLLALWALAAAGCWDTLALGQIYLPLVLAAVIAWLLLERGRDAAAGVLIGCIIALKPNFAAWPAVLLLAGHMRAPLVAFATAAMVSVVPLLTHGVTIYAQWADVILADENRIAFLTNASIPGLAARIGMPTAGMIAAAAVLAMVAAWAFYRRPPSLEASAAGIIASIAASPIAWVHYTLFLLPVFFRWHKSPVLVPAAALLVVPVAVGLRFLDAPAWQQLTIGSAYNWAIVLCLSCAMPAVAGLTHIKTRHRGTDDRRAAGRGGRTMANHGARGDSVRRSGRRCGDRPAHRRSLDPLDRGGPGSATGGCRG